MCPVPGTLQDMGGTKAQALAGFVRGALSLPEIIPRHPQSGTLETLANLIKGIQIVLRQHISSLLYLLMFPLK